MQIIQSGFLSEVDRKALTALTHGVSSPWQVTRRANAVVLLDSGWSRQQVRNTFLNITSRTSSGASSTWRRKRRSLRHRIKLRFVPSYSPHVNPIERLCGLMQKNATPTGCFSTSRKFADATIDFLHGKVPGTGEELTSW